MADVNIASILARRDSRKATWLARRNSHHTAEWLVGDLNIRSKLTRGLSQLVMVQVWLWKVISQQSETRYDGIPAPSLVFDTDDIDHQGITRLGTIHVHGAGERVNEGEIQRPDCL